MKAVRVYGRKIRHQQLCLSAVWPWVGHCPSLNLAEEHCHLLGTVLSIFIISFHFQNVRPKRQVLLLLLIDSETKA